MVLMSFKEVLVCSLLRGLLLDSTNIHGFSSISNLSLFREKVVTIPFERTLDETGGPQHFLYQGPVLWKTIFHLQLCDLVPNRPLTSTGGWAFLM